MQLLVVSYDYWLLCYLTVLFQFVLTYPRRNRGEERHLAVADLGVPGGVGSEDSAQSRDASVALKGGVFWQRAVQVSLDLIRGQRACAQGLFDQLGVVTRVSGHVVHSSCTVTPVKQMAQRSHTDPLLEHFNTSEALPTWIACVAAHRDPSAVKHTWELHPQLSPQGLGNASDDQVSRLPREKHAGAASVFGEVDVPGLLLHLFFELSITQLSTRHAVYALALQLSVRIVHHYAHCASLNAHPHSPSLPFSCIATIQSDPSEVFTHFYTLYLFIKYPH